jgi:hypothetical protein
MSEADAYDGPDADTPSMDELDRVAFDAVVRNAPRFGRFIGTGVAIGAAGGLVIGLVLPNTTAVGRGIVALLVAAGFAIIGAIVAAALSVGLDGTHSAPTQSGFPWEPPEVSAEPDANSVGHDATQGEST